MPFGGGHVFGDAAAQADDLDLFIGPARRCPRRSVALPRVVEQEGVQIGMAHMFARGLYLGKINPQCLCPRTDGG